MIKNAHTRKEAESMRMAYELKIPKMSGPIVKPTVLQVVVNVFFLLIALANPMFGSLIVKSLNHTSRHRLAKVPSDCDKIIKGNKKRIKFINYSNENNVIITKQLRKKEVNIIFLEDTLSIKCPLTMVDIIPAIVSVRYKLPA